MAGKVKKEKALKKISFLDYDNCVEVFRQLFSNSEIPFFQFDRAVEFDDLDQEGNKIITFLGAFQMREDYNSKLNEERIILHAVFMQEDPEEIEQYNQEKAKLDDLIKAVEANKDSFSVEEYEEQKKKLSAEYRRLHRLSEYDETNAEEVYSRPPMQLVFHSEKTVEVNPHRLVSLDIGGLQNPTFFELKLTQLLLKLRFAQRVRSLDGLYTLEINKNNNFI